MAHKIILLMIGIFMVSISTFSQVEEKIVPDNTKQKEKRKFTERIVFGGDIGLSFGTITYIKLAPIIGYQVTSRLTAGLGPIYIYENYKDYHLETSTYGGKVLLSYTLIKNSGKGGSLGIGDIMLHAENEVINVEPLYESYYYGYYFGDRIWIDNLLIGGGLYQPISGRFGVSMFILWDVTQNTYSPYTNPIFKFGFNF